jgi:hypothetical protein
LKPPADLFSKRNDLLSSVGFLSGLKSSSALVEKISLDEPDRQKCLEEEFLIKEKEIESEHKVQSMFSWNKSFNSELE